jgi:general secretion pathway protein B
MAIGGSVYSQQPVNRMVIINGQVFREGSAVTPDLLLEQIGPKSAVFSLRGQRFEMPF